MINYRMLFLFTLIFIIFLIFFGNYGISQEIPSSSLKILQLSLSNEILTVKTTNKTSFIATVNNTGTEILEPVNVSIEGIITDWISVFPQAKNISPGNAEKYLVIIEIPRIADSGIYQLRVKATDSVESNTENLTLVIGRDLKEISDLLLKEIERIKIESGRALLIQKCLDTTIIKTYQDDANLSLNKGMEEYTKKNYESAINWFEYVVPIEKKIVSKTDSTINTELKTVNGSKFLIPPFYKSDEQFQLAENYLTEKNYEKICDSIIKIRKYIIIGFIFWPGMVIFFVILFIIFFVIYKKNREKERESTLMKIKERLDKP